MPPQVDVQKIAADYLRRALDDDLEQRIENPDRSRYGVQYEPQATPDRVDAEWLEAKLQNARRELADRKYGSQRPFIDEQALIAVDRGIQ
jgi:carbamoylphosphate synthase small subunit